jgi:23S rRNA (cytosine1962-C5)-methyltransferase
MTETYLKQVHLRRGRDEPLRRGHPWIFSGGVGRTVGDPVDGDRVQVLAVEGQVLGWGHYHEGSIRVKMLAHGEVLPSDDLFHRRLLAAWQLRQMLGLGRGTSTTGYRLVHGEGDGLPGIIIDIYGSVAVVQAHTIGMYRELPLICDGLRQLSDLRLEAIFQKSSRTLPVAYAREVADGYAWGEAATSLFVENGIQFMADWEGGQKTGFFLDQRENRSLLQRYAAGRSVLNTFSYSGGFSLYALRGGATRVESVDASAQAGALTQEHLTLNGLDDGRHRMVKADVLPYLRAMTDLWDIVVLDPPAFAKNLHKRHQAVQGYKRLNALGMQRVQPGGLLMTFSCSQVVDAQLFRDTVMAAALDCGRTCRILHTLSQGPDHPTALALPESGYLKGLVLQIDGE